MSPKIPDPDAELPLPLEPLELALGTPLELWLGGGDESQAERAARLDAARGILRDEPELYVRALGLVVALLRPYDEPTPSTDDRRAA